MAQLGRGRALRAYEPRAPGPLTQLAEVVAHAGQRDLKVRAVGSGHSFSDIACTEGILVSLDRLAGLLEVDRASGLVRVQAGITIRELSRRLLAHGLALENLGDIDVQSDRGRDLHRHARHGRQAAQHLLAGARADAGARRRLDAQVLRASATRRCSPRRVWAWGRWG